MGTVAVVGVGAIGGYVAAQLIDAGHHDVTLCVRSPFDELVLESGGRTLRSRPRMATDPAEVGTVDWVLLACKAHQTAGAGPWFDALVGDGTTVVALQNGIEHEERLRPLVGQAAVVPAVVYAGAELVAPGHVVHRTNGFLIVPDSLAGRAVRELFAGTATEVGPTGDFVSSAWKKLVANVAANGITASTGRRMEVFTEPDIVEVTRALVRECLAVARAEGAEVDDGYADALAEGMGTMTPEGGTSMLYDRLAGRPLEVDALFGAVLRAAARHGIEVPRTEVLAALLGAISATPGRIA